jgi:hypothetical protein
MRLLFRYFTFVLLLVYGNILLGQDIEQVAKAPWVNANGGLTMSHIGNFSVDSTHTEQTYSYYLSGNLNTQLWEVVDLPISFSYTNNQIDKSLPQPFNRFSLAPSYKWVKTYMGYANMSFSSYTLSGHEFLGGGVELTPDKSFSFSAMFGQLNKAVKPDTLGSDPCYKRLGGGFKMGYNNEKFDIGFNIFKAKDLVNSLTIREEDSVVVKPKDNITGSLMLKLKLINNLSVSAEYALSYMNQDISIADSIGGSSSKFFEQRGDVTKYNAVKASISQSSKIGNVGVSYERVAPNYNTLGAYYFNNDFENITADLGVKIIPRVNLSMNVGLQKDNLLDQETTTSKRLIYSITGSLAASKKLSVNASVSNVQNYVHIKDIYDEVTQTNEYENLDTLSYTQLNFTSSGNVNYILKSNDKTNQNLNAGFSYQQASEIQSDDSKYIGNRIYNGNLSYQYSLSPRKFNVSSTINYNYNQLTEYDVKVLSVNFAVRKDFFEKLKTSLTTTYSNSSGSTNIINIRLSGGYVWLERHNFNLSLSMVNNKKSTTSTTQYGANFTYSYMFNFSLKRENKKFNIEGNF